MLLLSVYFLTAQFSFHVPIFSSWRAFPTVHSHSVQLCWTVYIWKALSVSYSGWISSINKTVEAWRHTTWRSGTYPLKTCIQDLQEASLSKFSLATLPAAPVLLHPPLSPFKYLFLGRTLRPSLNFLVVLNHKLDFGHHLSSAKHHYPYVPKQAQRMDQSRVDWCQSAK